MNSESATTILLHTAVGPIALSPDELEGSIERAKTRRAETCQTAYSEQGFAGEPLLTAAEISARFSMDATWFLTRAREDRIPHVRIGKYVRFDLVEIRDFFCRKPDRHANS